MFNMKAGYSSLKSGFSDLYLLEKYLTDNQLHPVGHIYFDEQDTTDPHDPGMKIITPPTL